MKFPESERETYSRNPLIEVICQLRFPKILRIETEVPVDFQEAVRTEYPILNTSRAIELPFLTSPQIGSAPVVLGQGATYEFLDAKNTWKLVLSSDFISLSTLDYQNWEDFRKRLYSAIDLLVRCYSPSHFTRAGLRYQDLIIRSELELEGYPWRNLLQAPVLGVFITEDLPEEDCIDSLSLFACRLDDSDAILRVQYGLARKNTSEELGYLIDADFYTETIMEISDANNRLDKFNREAGNFFRWCITEELRQSLQPQPIS